MADDPGPENRPELSGANMGWVALSYLLSGILVWGVVGWLVDRWLDLGGVATAIGCVVGAGAWVYLVVRRLGA